MLTLRRAQTATEYLIILAVVIIVSLVVISSLGGVTFIGGNTADQVTSVQLRNLDVGILDIAQEGNTVSFILRNNQPETILISDVRVGSISCMVSSFLLGAGESRRILCSTGQGESDVRIVWSPITGGRQTVSTSLPNIVLYSDELFSVNGSISFPSGCSTSETMLNIELVLYEPQKSLILNYGIVGLQSGYSFELNDIPEGEYVLFAKGEYKYVRIRVDNLDLTEDILNLAVNFIITGDINGDNVVDSEDSALISAAWFTSEGNPNWNPNADLNCDGVIQNMDNVILNSNLGNTGESLP